MIGPAANMKILLILAKNSSKTEIKLLPQCAISHITTVSHIYFANDCLWKHLFASNSPQIPSNLISLTILITLSPLTQF